MSILPLLVTKAFIRKLAGGPPPADKWNLIKLEELKVIQTNNQRKNTLCLNKAKNNYPIQKD